VSRSFTMFSGFLLYSMHQFARSSQEVERELDPKREAENRSFALGAIISSVAFLEAHVNEFFMIKTARAFVDEFQIKLGGVSPTTGLNTPSLL